MQFLKTLFWILVAVVVALFARSNWSDVTLDLWGDIQADIKIPVLLLIFFLIGFLPTWLIMRAKLWTCRRRLDSIERTRAATIPAGAPSPLDRQKETE
jgi:lipopolysaccharide assembly protein A